MAEVVEGLKLVCPGGDFDRVIHLNFDLHAVVKTGCLIEIEIGSGAPGWDRVWWWERKIEATAVLGTVYPSIGPREWSPREGLPEGFERLVEIKRNERLTIKNEGRYVATEMLIWKAGDLGILSVASPFWEYLRKQPR